METAFSPILAWEMWQTLSVVGIIVLLIVFFVLKNRQAWAQSQR